MKEIITSIEDLRTIARRRVPRIFYDYVDGGSWTEYTYRANESDFQKLQFRQRVAVDIAKRSTATTMVGQEVSMPVAIAPTGLTGMQHANGEILAAVCNLVHSPTYWNFWHFSIKWYLNEYGCLLDEIQDDKLKKKIGKFAKIKEPNAQKLLETCYTKE